MSEIDWNAKKNRHIDRYEHNVKFRNSIDDKDEFADWKITISFYAAIHFIEAVLCLKKISIENHQDRGEVLRKYPEMFKYVEPLYRKLSRLAHKARYDEAIEIVPDEYKKAFNYLNDIESELKSLIT